MTNLIPLSDLVRDRNYDFRNEGIYDPTGSPAYGSNGQKLGTIRGAMAEPDSGRLRYLLVDVGGWFTSKEVLVPVGLARIEDDAVYFDSLTKDQVKAMGEYRQGQDYDYTAQSSDERVLRGNQDTMTMGTTSDTTLTDTRIESTGVENTGSNVGMTGGMTSARYNYRDEDTSDTMFKTPQRLRLLEERLLVDKDRYVAGSVEIGKRVETQQQQVNVDLRHEEVYIERHAVTSATPIEGNVTLGSDTQTIRVDLEAERADVRKQAYVTEEVSIGEREVSETQTFTETVGREVLDVNRTGDVNVHGDNLSTGSATSGMTSTDTTTSGRVVGRDGDDRNLLDRAGDALDRGVDRLDGKIDRDKNR